MTFFAWNSQNKRFIPNKLFPVRLTSSENLLQWWSVEGNVCPTWFQCLSHFRDYFSSIRYRRCTKFFEQFQSSNVLTYNKIFFTKGYKWTILYFPWIVDEILYMNPVENVIHYITLFNIFRLRSYKQKKEVTHERKFSQWILASADPRWNVNRVSIRGR